MMRIPTHLTLLFLFCCLSWAASAQSAVTASLEQLKAAILFNFARYTEWPASAMTGPSSPIRFCIADDPGVTTNLKAQSNRLLKDRPIEVVSLDEQPSLHCHVAYIAKSSLVSKELLQKMLFSSTLLVTDDESGMIRLVRDNSRLVFEIDRGKAEAAGVTLSSHLLRLARSVSGGS